MSYKGVKDLYLRIEGSKELIKDLSKREKAEKWSTKYVNDLPNAAFAVVEKGYKEGDSPKTARHLPHHTKDVESATENSTVDLSHYRNALARVNQIKNVLGNESDSALRKRASKHLEKHRAVLDKEKSGFNKVDALIREECEKLFRENVEPILLDTKPEEE